VKRVRAGLIALLAAAMVAAAPAADAATSFVVTGHGFGHGIGLSQYGAYGYARHGFTARQVLRHYYRGTTIGTVPSQPVRVLLADGRASVQVSSGQPISVVDSAGQWEVLPAGTYTLRAPLSLPGWPAQTPPMPPVSFDAGAAQLAVDGTSYRGSLSIDTAGSRLSVVNTVPLESYLLGVVPREMPASWAPEALRAQAVAARSYALASLHPDSAFDVYADTRSQVYGGAGGEDTRTTAAVQATAGQVVLWHGKVAQTFFHSSSGGRTATVTDVWPAAQALPYLVSVADPYDSASPYHDWAPLTFTAAGAARKLGVPGLKDLTVATNRSLRAASVAATGARGTKRLDPATVEARLGLRSTWFRIGVLRLDPVTKPVTPKTRARLTGLVRGVPGARIERKVGHGRWIALSRVGGAFTRRFRTPATALYRLSAPGVVGPAVRVTVRPR
jgi:SpoIID/LytB domain protein